MKFSKQDWIKVLCGIAIGSYVLAFAQGWWHTQLLYFVILSIATFMGFVIWHRKESKTIDLAKAKEIAENELRRMKIPGITESGGKVEWMSKYSDNKRFSSYGKIIDIEFSCSPNKVVVQIDAKTGKVLNVAANTQGRDPPFFKEWKEPMYYRPYPGRGLKREYKEEVKPE